MTTPPLDRVLADLPARYAGPGGAVAVLREGEVIARHAWGWADAARRIPFTPRTMSLICSISKQFTCALLLDLFPDPTVLEADLHRRLPLLEGEKPGILHLMHNQSGLRDYWAVAMLYGAPVEGVFTGADAERIVSRSRSLHFTPGSRYSYCNQNFRLLSDLIAQRTGQDFGQLLRARIFDPIGMGQAVLNADTSGVPGGTIGYEGSVAEGFRPAVNHIVWTGDAGIAASLDDMIAWEQRIDATRDDPAALYSRLAAPVTFRNGAPAAYGFGLARTRFHGLAATCHEGGLRGFRSFRAYLPEARLSIVTLFNHMADPRGPTRDILAALLDEELTGDAPGGDAAAFAGRYIEPESGLAVRIAPEAGGQLMLGYGHGADHLAPAADGAYRSAASRLFRSEAGLCLERPNENLRTVLEPMAEGQPARDITGVYRSAELGAEIACSESGGVLYAAFQGFLGQGEMQAMIPFGADTWLIPCPRALDYSAPGDWTFRINRDAAGRATSATLGCWLARGIAYDRI